MEDSVIVELANKEDAVIVTMDKDFGELIFKKLMSHNGVFITTIR